MGNDSEHAWGDTETRFFYELTPERILDAVETAGVLCTGRVLQLNSMENRVYQVEVECDEEDAPLSEKFRVAKFYRPGRWSKKQILEEHTFLLDLVEEEIPVVAPVKFGNGTTLTRMPDADIFYSLFPRIGGRAPDEMGDDQLEQLGRLLARLHQVGASREADARIKLDPQTYGRDNLAGILDSGTLPDSMVDGYRGLVEGICTMVEPWFAQAGVQRIHGDCHLGNVLWGAQGAFLVDFDDMVRGPCVQDIWLLVPGRDAAAARQRDVLLSSYEQLRAFDRSTLRLIEPLRTLRYIHFSAWIAKRWDDPAFKRVFHDFGSERYWHEQLQDLREQYALIQELAYV